MSAIFKRDLRAYFKSPLGYVYLAAFVLVLNIYFYLMNVYSGSSSMDGIFSFIVTIEGNANNACKQLSYAVGDRRILGYGVLLYATP